VKGRFTGLLEGVLRGIAAGRGDASGRGSAA
jgi:hypothetical protein